MRNSGVSKIIGIGDVLLETSIGGKLLLKNVRHVPDIRLNLISIDCLDDEGYCSIFNEDYCSTFIYVKIFIFYYNLIIV